MSTRTTPWRDEQEWLSVKASFYPQAQAQESLHKDPHEFAIERVKAWSARGRVPHAVVSTSMLTSAMIRDRTLLLSTLETRMMLAMAVVRFVNGLLDPAQQAVFAISMNALAKTLGLPETFVELRHSATHDALPSLPALRGALIHALHWLWNNYWNTPDQRTMRNTKSHSIQPELHAKLDVLLKKWRRARKVDPYRPLKTGDAEDVTKLSLSLLKELSSIHVGSTTTPILAEKLLQPKNLLSAGSNAEAIWKPFLEHALRIVTGLSSELITQGIKILGGDAHAADLDVELKLMSDSVAAPSRRNPGIPNIEGSYDRLQAWIVWLILDKRQVILDTAAVCRSLSIEQDKYTLEIMYKLESLPEYASMNRLIKLRLGEILVESVEETKCKRSHDSDKFSKLDDVIEEKLLKITKSGNWQRFQPSHSRPFGFLIS